ncbi:phosphotransferase [Rathayibacter sp. VKM Ac-2759]|uniref:phosphotransferase family protein n=1 Tax=Rathayibacter sp. VKM Ac-2759 TaxID=2609252 RepID=UPI00131791C5|nr:phosphotransferase [Rathayibacter sp. VKM Ac-2759]QHC66119.1 phosphotransferase [Rathayibacter sp. VKM Ac-2759]
MRIEQARDGPDLLRWLVDRGLVDRVDCLAADFSLEERSGRNLLVVVRTRSETLTIKFFDRPAARIREENALDELAATGLAFGVPTVVETTETSLICRTVGGLLSVTERWPTALGPRFASRLGAALASLHAIDPAALAPAPQLPLVGRPGVEAIEFGAALREVIGLLQADGTAEVMDEVAAELAEEDEVFSHGDIRGRNILVLPGRGGGVHLIDWETSGRCSRWFDLGAGLALFIETALLAGRGAPSGATLLTYLAAYSRSSGHQIDVALTVQCAGVRLIQSAMESTREGAERSLVAERLLTVGGLALRSPLQVARRLEVLR